MTNEQIVEKAIAIVREQHAGYEMKLADLITQTLNTVREEAYNAGLERAVRAEKSLEDKMFTHRERLETWNDGEKEGRRRERRHILKVIDGHKEVYKKADKRIDSESKDGDEKGHIDSCCNETIDGILQALDTTNNNKET